MWIESLRSLVAGIDMNDIRALTRGNILLAIKVLEKNWFIIHLTIQVIPVHSCVILGSAALPNESGLVHVNANNLIARIRATITER